jgi:ribonuclease P protein component
VLIGRRAALTREFAALLDDLRAALKRVDRQPEGPRAAKRITSGLQAD